MSKIYTGSSSGSVSSGGQQPLMKQGHVAHLEPCVEDEFAQKMNALERRILRTTRPPKIFFFMINPLDELYNAGK